MQNKRQNNGSESSQFQLNYILQSPNLANKRIQREEPDPMELGE